MAGIYIHIPFCKQACFYCDFHFSTNTKYVDQMVAAIAKELVLKSNLFKEQTVATVYFGGGTPSLLSVASIQYLIQTIQENYQVSNQPEITLEANPDDLSEEKIIDLSKTPINRLSIGVQSFFDKELTMMNRAHNAANVQTSLAISSQYFKNITIDLIYGIPGLTEVEWRENIKKAMNFGVNHISSYALTVEEKTALSHLIQKGKYPILSEHLAAQHFEILVEELTKNGFDHYEISNFGKPGFYSKHNQSYWQGVPYLGFGPSAHSFLENKRFWNISNNQKYIQSIQKGIVPQEVEVLSEKDRFNEYLMTGLRTIWGVSLDRIQQEFGEDVLLQLKKQLIPYVTNGTLELTSNKILKTTTKGKFLADGIAADLFWI